MNDKYMTLASDKSKKTTTILCCIGFLGVGGLHDFYLGNIKKGLIKIFTLNWFLVGTIMDLIKILNGVYLDAANQPVKRP